MSRQNYSKFYIKYTNYSTCTLYKIGNALPTFADGVQFYTSLAQETDHYCIHVHPFTVLHINSHNHTVIPSNSTTWWLHVHVNHFHHHDTESLISLPRCKLSVLLINIYHVCTIYPHLHVYNNVTVWFTHIPSTILPVPGLFLVAFPLHEDLMSSKKSIISKLKTEYQS